MCNNTSTLTMWWHSVNNFRHFELYINFFLKINIQAYNSNTIPDNNFKDFKKENNGFQMRTYNCGFCSKTILEGTSCEITNAIHIDIFSMDEINRTQHLELYSVRRS